MTFSSKTAAIAGADGGIARALCRYFGAAGAKLAVIDRHPPVEGFAERLLSEGFTAEFAVESFAALAGNLLGAGNLVMARELTVEDF